MSNDKSTFASDRPSLRMQRSRVDLIRQELLEFVLSAALGPGDPLPSELELAEGLGVSRNSLREAVKSLQALGIVEIRHGQGTFIAERTFAALSEILAFAARHSIAVGTPEARELVDVREALETGLLDRALQLITRSDIDTAREAVAEMEQLAAEGRSASEADMRFHASLFRALDNQLLAEVLTAFWLAYDRLADALTDDHADPAETAHQHALILDAAIAGDVESARTHLREHFTDIRARIETAVKSRP